MSANTVASASAQEAGAPGAFQKLGLVYACHALRCCLMTKDEKEADVAGRRGEGLLWLSAAMTRLDVVG